MCRDHQQGSRWSFRTPATLLPVLKSRDAYANHRGKFRLRLAKLLPHRLDVFGGKLGHPAGLLFAPADGAGLSNAQNKAAQNAASSLEFLMHQLAKNSKLPRGRIFFLVFAIGVEHVERLACLVPEVDDAAPSTFALPCDGLPHFAQAAALRNHHAFMRSNDEGVLQRRKPSWSNSSSIESVKMGVSTNRVRLIVRQWRIDAISIAPTSRYVSSGVKLRPRNFTLKSSAIRANTSSQSPHDFCRNNRIVGYQGLSSRSTSQRQSAANGSATQIGTPSAPARCASDESDVITRSSVFMTAAVSMKSENRLPTSSTSKRSSDLADLLGPEALLQAE